MTLEQYYGEKLQMLRNGQQYLSDMIAEYPVKKTADGIQPILYINSRIKAPESLTLKLQKKGLQEDCDTALTKIHDLIGIRVICSFGEEVYRVAEWISNREHVEVIERKDYIAYPKPNGYRSLHLIVKFTEKGMEQITAEIQIRTIAMDFWASLEHKIYYKFEGDAPDYISRELQECAQMVSELDDKMLSLNEAIQACLEVENTPVPVEPVKEKQEQEKKQEDIVEHIWGKES